MRTGSIDPELMRIGVSIPDTLLEKFDKILDKRCYSSRSEGIRDAIRNYIKHYEWMNEVNGERIGVVTMIYCHDHKGLINNMTGAQREYVGLIRSSLHVYLDEDNWMEILTLRGDAKDIKGFTERMMSLKGIKYVKLNTIKVEHENV